jgi:hypothetical protein
MSPRLFTATRHLVEFVPQSLAPQHRGPPSLLDLGPLIAPCEAVRRTAQLRRVTSSGASVSAWTSMSSSRVQADTEMPPGITARCRARPTAAHHIRLLDARRE